MIEQFYNRIIDEYLIQEKHSPHSQIGQLAYYSNLPIEDAVENAVFGRYTVGGHQYFSDHYKYFPQVENGQPKARAKILAIADDLKKVTEFLLLYHEVRRVTQDIHDDMGRLFYYDTALRIAACRDLNKSPEHVFLQRGALMGAEATGVNISQYTYTAPYVSRKPFDQLAGGFNKLETRDIEALLCVYHTDIAKFMKSL